MANITTLKDFYLRYPYKKNPDSYIPGLSKTIPVPYIKAEDITDHNYSVDYHTYKKIMMAFFEFLFQYLLWGGRYKMPGRIGDLIIQKYKRSVKKNINWGKYKATGNHYNEKNIPTNRYSPTLKWKRGPRISIHLVEINWWNFLPSHTALKRIGQHLNEDPTRINNYQTYSRR